MSTGTTVQITMPAMGESVTEGTVLEWRKQVGDHVEKDEPLVDISTDKVDTEIPAPVSGTLTAIHIEADQVAAVGAVLGEVAAGEEGDADPEAAPELEPEPESEGQEPEAEGPL